MSERRDEFLKRVEAERVRQRELAGSEYDLRNTPNDWVAIAGHYLSEEVRRGASVPEASAFEDALVKAAAVMAAAFEHIEIMQNRSNLQ
jgi:hypothetical protein